LCSLTILDNKVAKDKCLFYLRNFNVALQLTSQGFSKDTFAFGNGF
jgi:hypothetical protein